MIPIFRPTSGPEELEAVAQVLQSGWWGLGPKVAEFERAFGEFVASPHCIGTNSASLALLLALTSLDLEGREVITTSLTFVATNNAILQAGAVPVFADVDPVTLTIDPADVERLVTPRTAAIMAVDYAGHPADYASLRQIARPHSLALVDDAAHACGASLDGQPVGSIADITCFSFHAVKNLAMGEGGAITLADGDRAERLRRLRWMGLSKGTWDRSGGDRSGARYAWEYDLTEIGFKAHLSDIPAAIGLVQLRRLASTNARRREIAERYSEAFADLEWLSTPVELPGVRSSWHLYVVRVPERARFMAHLTDRGVSTGVHYRPNHHYRPYRDFSRPLPVTDAVWTTLVSLPIFPDLTDAELDQVIEAVRSFEPTREAVRSMPRAAAK